MRPDWKVHTRQKGIPMSLDLGGNWNHIVGGGRGNNIQTPPQTALGKLKGKGKVREISSPLCHHWVKKQSHLKDTKYEAQRRHFEFSNSSWIKILLLFLCFKVKHDRKQSICQVLCASLHLTH